MAAQPVPIKHSSEIRLWLVLMGLFWEYIQKKFNLRVRVINLDLFFHSTDRAVELKADF